MMCSLVAGGPISLSFPSTKRNWGSLDACMPRVCVRACGGVPVLLDNVGAAGVRSVLPAGKLALTGVLGHSQCLRARFLSLVAVCMSFRVRGLVVHQLTSTVTRLLDL